MYELEKRLRARGTETEEQILERLRNAEAEIQQGESSGIFDHVLYNDNLEKCYERLKCQKSWIFQLCPFSIKDGSQNNYKLNNFRSREQISEVDRVGFILNERRSTWPDKRGWTFMLPTHFQMART